MFAIERWQKARTQAGSPPPDDVPVALSRDGPHGPVVHAVNRAARLAGILPGARVVDMRGICPELTVEYADVAGDAKALERLMFWARRWCPWTVVDGVDGLFLDTTGADHLLGGEAAMLAEMEARLSLLGLTSRLAIAPTCGAAWALACFGPVRAICAADRISAQLAPLPVAALRLDDATLLLLKRLGLKTIGALADVPRLSLTRRFGDKPLEANPLLRLDQATGHLPEPVASPADRPPILAQKRLPEPIQDPTHYLPDLCAEVCAQLEAQGAGCRRLHLTIYRTDGEVSRLTVTTAAPSRDGLHLQRLFDDRLERIDPGFGFDVISLEADMVERLGIPQKQLDGSLVQDVHLPHLVDRLVARFGTRAVQRPVLRESHLPERAEAWVTAQSGPVAPSATAPRPRPIRLLTPPEEVRVLYAVPEGPPQHFIWRAQAYRIARYDGPERIAPEWWHDKPDTRLRDYFRVEDQAGRRLWVYREGLHGDGRGGPPRWFVHGMFA